MLLQSVLTFNRFAVNLLNNKFLKSPNSTHIVGVALAGEKMTASAEVPEPGSVISVLGRTPVDYTRKAANNAFLCIQ